MTSCALWAFLRRSTHGRTRPWDPVIEQVAAEYLAPMKGEGVDTLILGCTHYPLLTGTIRMVMGPDVALIDPGRETADAVKDALEQLELLNGTGGTARYFVSDAVEQFRQVADLFLGEYAGGPVEQIPIETY